MFRVEEARAQFPALQRTENGKPIAYFDGPGGTQMPRSVIEAIGIPLERGVSNLGGSFASSRLAGEITDQARMAMADLFGAADPQEIVFGQNMTSLTFSMSRALARSWRPGDRIVVTSLDHDANITPWRMAAADVGVAVDVARFDTATGRLPPESVSELVTDRTRLVALTHASNALGTVPDVRSIASIAHEVGARVYVDAVHYTPHGVVDIGALDVDFLVASAYKFHGPHTGVLWGRRRLLEELEAYKVRPAPSTGAGKWETGTQSFEALAGVTAAADYLASLGSGATRRARLVDGHSRVGAHVGALAGAFLDSLPEHVTLHGPRTRADRTPTFALTVGGMSPGQVAERLATAGLAVWAGHYYALEPMAQLGLLDRGGAVRVGFVHTTTPEEVDRLLHTLTSLKP